MDDTDTVERQKAFAEGYGLGYADCEESLIAKLRERMVTLVVQKRDPYSMLDAMQVAFEADTLATYIMNGAGKAEK